MVPELIQTLEKREKEFVYFIFFSYRYYHSYYGVKLLAHKAILVPTAEHDQVIYLSLFKDFFNLPAGLPMTFIHAYVVAVLSRVILLWIWSALYFGIKTWMEWKLQEARKEKANLLAQDAQLRMLRYQLNPHFLFNSLNSIRTLVDENEVKAREMITELSEFRRYSLNSKDYTDVPLKHEMEAIRYYFAIQKKRYEDKLEVVYDIEPEAGEYPVLSFLIHPLVENAVKYGTHTSSIPLTVSLTVRTNTAGLTIEACNTGRWGEPDRPGASRLPARALAWTMCAADSKMPFPTGIALNFLKKMDACMSVWKYSIPKGATHEKTRSRPCH